MSPPDSYVVGLLGLGMAALGVVLGFGVLAILVLNSHRFLPLRRSRATYWAGMAVLVPVAFVALPPVSAQVVQHLAVIASNGWDAYADGLRVINKHGELSNGRYLGVFWSAAMGGGMVSLIVASVIPVTVWYLHFNPDHGIVLAGVVRLDGEPVAGAEVTFYIVAGRKLRGFIAVETDEAGRYEVCELPPRTFRVTVTGGAAAVPLRYTDARQTSLEFIGNQLGPVTHDFELESSGRQNAHA
jgi:hypothetical protein